VARSKDKEEVPSIEEYMSEINKQYGDNTAVRGVELVVKRRRLPTGIFSVDFATCGGIPLNQVTCFKGPESGGKSSVAMSVAATLSKMCLRCMSFECSCSLPKLTAKTAWLDVEGTFDRDWAEAIGLAPDDYYIVHADDAEQYSWIASNLAKLPDCGLIVVDSVGALVPSKVSDSAVYDQFIGNEAKLITRMIKLISNNLARRSQDHPCAAIVINQVRYKIGELYGNPETMPGGQALKHLSSMIVRFNKVALLEKEKKTMIDDNRKLNIAQRHSFTIEKHKVSILSGGGSFLRCKEDVYDSETDELLYRRGQVVEYQTVMELAKRYAVVTQTVGGKWGAPSVSDETGTQKDLIKYWRENDDMFLKVQRAVINEGMRAVFGGGVVF